MDMFKMVWRNSRIRRLLSASFVSQVGSFFTYMLLIVLLYGKTNSIGSTMGVVAASSIGGILSGFFVGMIVDRSNPVVAMALTDLLSAVAIGSLFWLPHNLLLYYAASMIIAILAAFAGPATQKYQRRASSDEELAEVNASISVVNELVKIIGPALAVFVLSLFPPDLKKAGFLIDAASYVISAMIMGWLLLQKEPEHASKTEDDDYTDLSDSVEVGETLVISDAEGIESSVRPVASQQGLWSRWKDGLSPLGNPVVQVVLWLFAFILIGISGVDVTLTAYVRTAGYSTLDMGYLMAALSVGIIVTVSFATRIFSTWPLSLQLGGSAVVFGAFYAAIGFVHSLGLMMVLSFLMGIGNGVFNVSASTYWQRVVPEEKMGRFFGIVGSVLTAMGLVGMAVNGTLGTLYGPSYVIRLCGGGIAIISAVAVPVIGLLIRARPSYAEVASPDSGA